ncbi:SDR family oxidoreductase [Flavobacterium sp. DG1-102-2]|uniref:SDR family oxidoreductase n=1 Tax=Flavobacterium sp. DG1-102-2 TaxID=3081663 RepID=UPI002949ADDC|nr:SDR family oxidoreductase [Flavobacterium sp. DG1-102-2]MDV6169082.1 SDR family oxidoreductase [Flavobacterium sp. DG1-102-2]
MKTALITGANKSIGFHTARLLLQQGFHVFIGSRTLENGQDAVNELKAEGFENVEAVQLDVTDDASVASARETVGKKTDVLDVLINNAGISGGLPQTPLEAPIEMFQSVYDTNVFGVVRVTQAFVSLLRKSAEPRIVNVTSGLGSLTLSADPTWIYYNMNGGVYNSSKAALNMYTIKLAYELRETPFKVNAVDPGYTKTDFNHHNGPGRVEDAASRVAKYALIDADGPTGKFFSEESNPETGYIPW